MVSIYWGVIYLVSTVLETKNLKKETEDAFRLEHMQNGTAIKSRNPERLPSVHILTPSLIGYVTLGKLFNRLVPQFLHL